VMLCQPEAKKHLADVRWVIVDEVQALAANKRGADLSLSLERLAALAKDPIQRIGLSATCTPVREAAAFLVGAGRRCSIAQVQNKSPIELTFELLAEDGRFLSGLVDRLEPVLRQERTTLIFTNVRSLAERLLWALSKRFPSWSRELAVHHSSLAAARRRQTERKLKQGRLRAVVAAASLESGIDIGQADMVVFIHPPGGVVQLLQRLGRSGHIPGGRRRGLILAATAGELFEAAVTAASGQTGQLEAIRTVSSPLDVLCQQLLGMATQRPWTAEEAFSLVRCAYPYRDLTRNDFDNCLRYLSGRDAEGESWLPSRLGWFGDEFSLIDERSARLLRRNLGTILAAPARRVKLDQGGMVGEVDDGFADSLQPGDRFLLDGRCLEYQKAERSTLLVEEVAGQPRLTSWSSEGRSLSSALARRIFVLREQAAEALREGPLALPALLGEQFGLEANAITAIAAFLQAQEQVSEIPTSHGCLIEVVADGFGIAYYIHTPLNRAGNDALARVVVRRLARDAGISSTSITAELGVAVLLARPVEVAASDWRHLLTCENFEEDLDRAIDASHSLRESFLRSALLAFMLLRNPWGGPRRVGGTTYAEQRLFDQVRVRDPHFVLLRQARADLYAECCDARRAYDFLRGLSRMSIHCRSRKCRPLPSPGHTRRRAPSPPMKRPSRFWRSFMLGSCVPEHTGFEVAHAYRQGLATDQPARRHPSAQWNGGGVRPAPGLQRCSLPGG
jgi:ATP-dependent helicase Lhr and Lhr-like helicase